MAEKSVKIDEGALWRLDPSDPEYVNKRNKILDKLHQQLVEVKEEMNK